MTLKRWGLMSISKRNLILLLALSLALTGTLWALFATPYDGPWTGTNSVGRAVSFTVSGSGASWSTFSYGISFSCSLGGTINTTITQSGPGAITDGEFSYSSSTLAFTGSFDSPTSASGTYTLTAYPVTHGLVFPPYVHTDYITHSGTWTAAFSGSLNSLELTSPNGGETWAAGSTHDITWTSLGEIANVKLEYSANSGTDWTTIVETTPNSGSYPWTLPGSPSATVLVRVSDAAAPTIFDTSAAVFSIVQAIPASERQALIALYNATTGDSWSDNHGWKTPPLALDGFAMPGTEETWAGVTVDVANSTVTQLNLIYHNLSGSIPSSISDLGGLQYLDLSGNSLSGSIPPELGGLTNLSFLSLYSNQLSGSIPGEIGSLTNLQTLMLFQNQLSGPIPAALGSLTSLFICHLGENQLSGTIPAALSGLTGAQQIVLSSNRLTGPIPAELGSLTGLMYLYLNGNQLSGPIPTALTGMVSMEPGGLNLGYNALYTVDPTLVAFLNSKNPGWASTQTITPTEITATALDGARILVSWLPIAYTADPGSYRIFSSVDPGGPYSAAGQTADKSASAAEVSGLIPGETYYFVVRAHTDAHANNPNAVESEDSSEASAVAWTRINPRIAGVVRVGSSPLPGVVMSGLVGNPVTDSNGAYDVTVAAGWSGTVTPTLAGYTFDPAFRTYSVLPDDQLAQDYSATQITFTVSGTVAVGATGLAGVTMAGLPHSPVTDVSGYYADAVPYGWSGTVTPTHSYYAFDPASRAYANVTSDQTGRNYSASLIMTPQRQALIAFYNSTNGDGWYNNSGWKTEPLYPDGFALPGTEGTWFGLTVDTETHMVTEINLVSNGLTGSLPSALATLTQLHGLYIGHNYMSGPIPPELGTLTGLVNLQLYNDQLTGSIPPELGNLVNLQSLALNMNQLTGSIPPELGSLSNLVQLRLNENQLSGTIPPEFGSLTNLSVLGLSWNSLTGSIPPELANLTGLQILVLSHNQLTGTIPPGFGGLVNLLNLGLDENHLSGTIPDGLGSLANLLILGLSSNQLSGAIPSGLGNLTQLVELHLNGNQLAGLIPTSFMNLTALTPNALMTDLGHNAVYTTDPDLITFLNSKDADWASTQTIAPTQVTATALDGANILVSWLPIPYSADAGSYKVFISQTPGSGYTLAGQTADKTTSWVQVNGLTPGVTYYFVIQTHTDVHGANQNAVDSNYSSEASATAWMQIGVNISGNVVLGGSPLSGVVMNGLPGNPVTDVSGFYAGTVPAGSTLTVTPTLAGYTFTPAFRIYTGVTADQTAQDYAATPVVVSSVTVTSPNGGEVLVANSSHSITWSSTGTIANVKIEYSNNAGTDWATVVGSTANSGTYAWTVPGSASASGLIKVSDASAPGINDTSNAVFTIVQAIPSSDRAALIAFYNSTNGATWGNNSSWKTPPLAADGFALPGTEGTWFGVAVNTETLRVTEINLVNNNLTGSLPAALGDLTGLQYLNINWNSVTGSIPATIGNLTNLTVLRLARNELSGGVPSALGNLSNLQELSVSNNPFGGAIPPELGNMTSLTWMSMNDAYLTGSIPPELGNLANLDYLGLDANQLTGSIPPELGNLTRLTMLLLHRNQLSGPIPAEFGGLASLRSLTLTENQLSGPIPPEFGNLSSLEYGYLDSNQFSGALPAQIGNLAAIEILTLAGNQLSGSIPSTVGNLTHLRSLVLQGNRLSGPIPSGIGNLTNLRDLRLWGNQLEGPIPASFMNLTALYDYSVDIGYNALFATDEALITFLNSKDADWASTQTIAPADVTATSLDNAVIMVSWLPVAYTADAGYYQILMSDTLGGPYTPVGQTADKATSSLNVTSLTPGQRYYFVVRTVTNAHANNTNIVDSENSAEASAVAWTQINVQITGTVLAGGLPLANVLMAGLPGTVVTNASGVYDASVAAGSSPTVTPTLEGYSFVPVSRAYPTITENQTAQDYTAFTIDTFTLTYTAGAGGTISGTTPQAVAYGGNGTEVTAVPNAGYHFVSWSDGVTTASRTDTNVIADITVTANFALGDFPYDGPWTGTNSEGRTVSLTVSGGGTAWSSFGYAIQFFCPAIGGTVSTTITQSGPGAITNGSFSYSSGTLAFAGTFGSPTTASGTYTLTGYPVIHGLPGPPFVHTDYITYSGTWTATFGGTIPTVTVTSPNGGESWAGGHRPTPSPGRRRA